MSMIFFGHPYFVETSPKDYRTILFGIIQQKGTQKPIGTCPYPYFGKKHTIICIVFLTQILPIKWSIYL